MTQRVQISVIGASEGSDDILRDAGGKAAG